MPLFDFQCAACDARSTLLLKAGETGACPECGSLALDKLVSPFSFRGAPAAAAPARAGAPKARTEAARHVCGGGCQHGTAERLVKKYLGP
jgi:putative FmdB family regulatory protein